MAGDSDAGGGVGRGSTGGRSNAGAGSSGRGGGSSGAGGGSAGGNGANSFSSDTPGAPSKPGRGSGKGNGGLGDPSTHTNIQGGRARGAPSDNEIGRDVNTGTQAAPSFRDDSPFSARSRSDRASRASVIGAGAMVSMDEAAEEAESAFGGFTSQMEAQAGPQNTGYGNTTYGGTGAMANTSQAAAMTRDQHTRSLEQAGVPSAIQSRARPGMVGKAASLATGLLGGVPGMALGKTANTALSARNASNEIGSLNDSFGTSLDSSFGNSFGEQAKGTAGGMAGGKLGGTAGARIGASVGGVPGAIAGALAGGAFGGAQGRDVAMNGGGSPVGTGSGEGGAPGLLASGMSQPNQPAQSSQPAQPGRNGYVSFDDYGSYAANFFG